ncbi:S1 RNA-binding domain-containing protein [Streptomyces sp. NPDC046876]|uniref:S1 RNA-binding domain-containing protein n=1 Tax=Streptomyces sp. NPDC046876 TaxID=3155616 RepID=UPI0033DC4421
MYVKATEHPELWTFLAGLRPGQILEGTVAALKPFGVFVALDEGPAHPVFPGVGFITVPELSWRRIGAASDVVRVGQRVSCEFLRFDDWNGEARLSLRALQPDPLRAAGLVAGQTLPGRVTRLLPFGAFVEVAEGVEGLAPAEELPAGPEQLRVGDEVLAVVLSLDLGSRRLTLSLRRS